ncbi:MAG: hypothetical protein IK104_06190 [Clostridia bacterium]|nr:hypothetical protein [Clostridia bacterium]
MADTTGSPRPADARNHAFTEDTPSLIVFVTGIGQSFSYLFPKKLLRPGAFKRGALGDYENYAPLVEEEKELSSWNLFAFNAKEGLRTHAGRRALAGAAVSLVGSALTKKNRLSDKTAGGLVRAFFALNRIDANGDADPRVITPRYPVPFSRYPAAKRADGQVFSRAKWRFYRSVPCEDAAEEALGKAYEDYLYCFNYRPCTFTSRNVEELHAFIETALKENTVGADKVVLVPMSMGASVVSAYLARYPDPADHHVRRVVSIVGCWRGTGVMASLVDRAFIAEPGDLIEHGLIGQMFGKNAEERARPLLKIFSADALSGMLGAVLHAFVREIIFPAPSLLALLPPEKYRAIRERIEIANARAEADAYAAAEESVIARLEAQQASGVGLSFISGYGLRYGEASPNRGILGLLRGADTANSDELIEISSTSPGVTAVPPGQRHEPAPGRVLSPDGSLDLTDAPFADRSWFFLRQKHELEYNNTVLRLALRLALGQIETVSDCADPAKTPYFPQFNGARNLKDLLRRDLPKVRAYLLDGHTLTPGQETLYHEAEALVDVTENDEPREKELLARFADMAASLG